MFFSPVPAPGMFFPIFPKLFPFAAMGFVYARFSYNSLS